MNSEPHIPNLENLKAEPERSSLRRKDENLNGATFKKPFSQISSNCPPECELKGVLHSLSLWIDTELVLNITMPLVDFATSGFIALAVEEKIEVVQDVRKTFALAWAKPSAFESRLINTR